MREVPLSPFDPSAWLARFTSAGGAVHVGAGGHLATVTRLHGYTPEQNMAACSAVREIDGDPVRLAAVAEVLASPAA